MKQYKRIFIIGHSGAGKGVLAKGVAEKLGWKYIDSDFALASSIGRYVKDILGASGEESFLRTLSEILSYQLTQENIVVTTDDSIVCSEKNRKLLASECTIYLKVSTCVQVERISHNRPLLPVTDYMNFLNKLHEERDALYEQSSGFTINSDDNDLEKHIQTAVNIVRG